MALRFNVRVDINPSEIQGNATRAEEILANQAMQDTEPFVPAKENQLSNKTKVVGGNKIVYPAPYSRYLYFGKLMVDPNTGSSYAKEGQHKVLTDKNLVFSKATHGKAQSHWFEASKAVNLDKWKRVYARAVTRGS